MNEINKINHHFMLDAAKQEKCEENLDKMSNVYVYTCINNNSKMALSFLADIWPDFFYALRRGACKF